MTNRVLLIAKRVFVFDWIIELLERQLNFDFLNISLPNTILLNYILFLKFTFLNITY